MTLWERAMNLVYNRKLLLFIIVLVAAQILGGCSNRRSDSNPKAENGMMDLTQLQFEKDVVRLDGEWEFYWNQLLEPGKVEDGAITGYIDIPGSWNKYTAAGKDNSENGYATYRLTFLTEERERLGLKLPKIRSAYQLWANGELCASAGTVGKNRSAATPQYLPQVTFFEAQQGENEIVIQVSNFYERSGGMTESIRLGSEESILGLRYKAIARELFLFGALMIIGVYHLILFFFRKKNKAPLYFGSFCVLVAVRTLLIGEGFFIYLLPGFNWEIAHKIQTLTFYLGVPCIVIFFRSAFPQYFHLWIVRMAQYVGAAFGLVVLLSPARVFTVINPLYQIWTVILIIYIIHAFMKITVRREKDRWPIVIGALALLLTSLNDIVYLSIFMKDYGPPLLKIIFGTDTLSSVGQLIFAVANSLLLAKRFSSSLEHEEVVTAELATINSYLDKLVLQRTHALTESNKKIEYQKLELERINQDLQQLSLKDSLTGIWNRRKYDETVSLEWNRCLRHKAPVALILLDVDHFKNFNDAYGHMAGDECLVKIGETIQNSLSRSTDMVARYGGEEFAVLLSETRKEKAISIAGMLREKIEALHIPHRESAVSNYVTVSIGVAYTVPNMNSSYEDLFKAADKALYQAKTAGRNQVKAHI